MSRRPVVDRAARVMARLDQTVRDIALLMDRVGDGLAVVVDRDGLVLDVVTDGDLRRASLENINMDAPIVTLLERKHASGRGKPVVCRSGGSIPLWRSLMIEHGIRHLPIVDEEDRFVDLVTWFDVTGHSDDRHHAVIMAGGLGTRLRPMTDNMPKPMLKIGGRPILERIVASLNKGGFRDLVVTTHYLPERIQDYFGDGRQFGVNIEYTHEDSPRGTAGALAMLKVRDRPIVVVNGDILTDLNFRALFDFHAEHGAALTVSVADYVMRVPYGVVNHEGPDVIGISEKPEVTVRINAGIYVVSPEAIAEVPTQGRFDMTDLIDALRLRNLKVVCFPIREDWLDIGRPEDFQRAQQLED